MGIPCPLAVEAFAAHLSYICKYDDKYSRSVTAAAHARLPPPHLHGKGWWAIRGLPSCRTEG